MASILFIENRDKTRFWDHVARSLHQEGHKVAWLVQNPAFAPAGDAADIRILPFPPKTTTQVQDHEQYAAERYPGLATDRGRRHFQAGVAHYSHYAAEIARCLEGWQPNVVVGESTLFHELMTIEECRKRDIPYFHPCANRYPQGRFSLFAYDTQLPAAESGESWPHDYARALAQRISSGTEVPFYMQQNGTAAKVLKRARWTFISARVWWARLRGEHYNTPSLIRKIALHRGLKANLKRWRRLQRLPSSPERTLLYPLQLQPEANIDVWGRPYSDQVALLKKLLITAPCDVDIAVKANPKAKYELSEELLQLAETHARLRLLPLEMSMGEAHTRATGALTVCGTVGLEAVFGRGRCISLRHPLIQAQFPNFHANSPEQAVKRLLDEPASGIGSVTEGARLIQRLVAQSFNGFISDPLSHPNCLDPSNIKAVSAVLNNVCSGRYTKFISQGRFAAPDSGIPAAVATDQSA